MLLDQQEETLDQVLLDAPTDGALARQTPQERRARPDWRWRHLVLRLSTTLENILAALSLQKEDLGPAGTHRRESSRPASRRIVATYDYTDEAGALLFQVLRYAPKQFRQRRPDGRGGWSGSLTGVRRVPYHLPELRAAIAQQQPVFLVEGEKDVESLRALGLAATTTPGGAAAWRAEYGACFGGGRVVLVPDNDPAGRDYVETAARTLQGPAAPLHLLELPGLPPKGDVSDWLRAGGTKEELLRLAEAAPPWEPRDTPGRAPLPSSEKGGSHRPVVETNGRNPLGVAHEATAALAQANDPPFLFRQMGQTMRAACDEKNRLRLEGVTVPALRHHLARAARFVSTSDKRGAVDVYPPLWLAEHLLATPGGFAQLPPLVGIVGAPILAPDEGSAEGGATLVLEQGYHPGLRVLYHEAAGALGLPDTTPTPANVAAARGLLERVFSGFPFADAASWAHCLALVLQPFVRPLIAGPTPLFLIEAPQIATGKTLLARTASAFFTPGGVDITAAPKDGAEWHKTIAALLRSGTSHLLFDNVKGHLDSDALEAALTATSYRPRLLGTMADLVLPNRATWMMTANNATLSPDLATRTVTIRLDAGLERPWERVGFAVPHPVEWLQENRARAVGAVLTLVRRGIEAGCPGATAGAAASRFGGWAAVMGGLLEALGVPGLLANMAEMRESQDPQDAAWQAFVELWQKRFGSEAVTTAELFPLAFGGLSRQGEETGTLTDYLDARSDEQRKQRLGKALHARRARVIAGWRLVRIPGKTPRYRLDPPQTGGVGGVGGVIAHDTAQYPSGPDTILPSDEALVPLPPLSPGDNRSCNEIDRDDRLWDDITDPFDDFDDDEASVLSSEEGTAPTPPE